MATRRELPITLRAEEIAAPLPPLLVAADRVAHTVAQGVHGRRRAGSGDAFWQFRPYQSGESSRRIDWRQSAKGDSHFVREREWEASQTVWVWRDASKSMSYSGDKNRPTKLRRATILSLALCSLLVRAGERIGLLGDPMPPGSGRAALRAVSERLVDEEPISELSLPQHEHLPRHSEVVLIGDFLSPLEEIESALRSYQRRQVRGHLVQILDPVEESLPFEGRVRFEGMEGEGTAYVQNVDEIREQYRKRLEDRRAALKDLAASFGWSFVRHDTSVPPETTLMQLYQAIQLAGRSTA